MKSIFKPKSIFGKLFISFLAVIFITLITVGALLSYMIEKYFYGMREFEAKQQAETVANVIQVSLTENDSKEISQVVEPLAESLNMKIKVMDVDGDVVCRALPEENYDFHEEELVFEVHELEQVFKGNTLTKKAYGPGVKRLLVAIPIPIPQMSDEEGETEEIKGIITLDAPLKGIEDTVANLGKFIIFSGLSATFIAGFIAFSLSRKIAGPLRLMNRAAKELASGNFKSRIAVDNDDEIGQIANTFNYAAIEIEKTIMEQRKMALLRKNLLDNVSHDFRTPLSSIRGYAELMIDGLLPEKDRDKYLRLILNNSKLLDRLLQDLLELSSLESGDITLRKQLTSANDLAKLSFNNVLARAKDKNISMIFQAQDALPKITVDKDRMFQVFNNLLDNAVRYTPEGGSIWMRTYLLENESKIVFEIEDTGIGISHEEQDKIWERFYKVDKTRSHAKQSFGLGLAITKQLVEMHEGRILIESGQDQGSIFKVIIPI